METPEKSTHYLKANLPTVRNAVIMKKLTALAMESDDKKSSIASSNGPSPKSSPRGHTKGSKLAPLGPRLSHSLSEQNLRDYRQYSPDSRSFDHRQENGGGLLQPAMSTHTLASLYHSAAGSPHSPYFAPVGSFPRSASNLAAVISDTRPHIQHRGELSANEKYQYDLSRAQLKATSRTSALLAGFAMVALVELQYDEGTPQALLITLGIVTTLLVSVHLIALMMSTCLLPHIEANGCTKDSPHHRLHFYIELSWLFSTCIGLLLFLLEIGVIFFVKFKQVNFPMGAYITTAILVPVFIAFVVISCLIHRERFSHSVDRVGTKVGDLENIIDVTTTDHPTQSMQKQIMQMGLVKQV